MTDQTMNPYAAPEANVEPTAGTESSFAPFPRFSAWWVFLLTIVTYGIYPWYWMFSRTQVINKHYPQHAISNGLVWSSLTVFISQFVVSMWMNFSAASASTDSLATLVIINGVLSLAFFVFWLTWIFSIRNRINAISGTHSGEPHWAGGVLTFFFSTIYLSYKINQIKDTE